MEYKIENDKLVVKARLQGGEITSIYNKENNTEYLWDGNPEYWKYHAPVLFPIVGKVNEGKYRAEGKTYELPQHGLARVRDFENTEAADNELSFELKSSESTLEVYPYNFVLRTKYTLDGNTVAINYTVENTDDKDIYFSIGAHPAFMCPIDKNDSLEDCYIELNKKETAKRTMLNKDGYLTHDLRECLNDTDRIDLSRELFKDDALVFSNLEATKMTIRSNKNDKFLEVDFTGFPYMGVWQTVTGSPFVCIEPWFGHADYEDFNGDFKEKEGIVKLEKGKVFSCTFKVTVG